MSKTYSCEIDKSKNKLTPEKAKQVITEMCKQWIDLDLINDVKIIKVEGNRIEFQVPDLPIFNRIKLWKIKKNNFKRP